MELLYGSYARLSWQKDVPNNNIIAIAIAIALSTNTLFFKEFKTQPDWQANFWRVRIERLAVSSPLT